MALTCIFFMSESILFDLGPGIDVFTEGPDGSPETNVVKHFTLFVKTNG